MAAYDYNINPKNLATQTVMFAIGSTLLHSAACIINDICDRDIDGQIDRTKNRPLVVGTIPLRGAWMLLAGMTISMLYLLSFANTTAKYYGILGIFPLHAFYPLMKRWTYWPQAWLGLAMNWGIIVAYTNVSGGHLSAHVIAFFIGTICWTIVYDTIYGCQDKENDIKVGVKSTSILFGDRVREILAVFALVFMACMIYAGLRNGHGSYFFLVSCGGAALHLAWQILTWRIHDRDDCGDKFKSNGNMGYIIWAGLLLDYWKKWGHISATS
ncbi:UbiA prenyltransferase family [Collybia nuda]|uniref:UbiA prenyltransferase family n=1 Tax=Collybia nuda TaxID=64659 RepID=A0A9P6CI15_9AGAR|nr:UbiA prenyltransferase family [Collybia nuda]